MLIENEYAIKLVELLKASKKLNQKKTMASFTADGSRCTVQLSWKRKNKKEWYAEGSTETIFSIMAAWTMTGEI